ncbi:MAG: RluA family pseudouridine synthase [Nostocales cyanobacterium LE14-WE4]|uniref:RluA family pseudouridine synthase n=1 Tax=Anabaena sp. AL09 TaxID=1710891 RepID=UPI0008009785|nr:RluA family pseudouridine synthase [Anabaena sp. AL09]MCE2698981.1 RluA family pseudouridine synthase [Anabaena sp. 49633_E8]MDJ0502587.1 RluA family pseudouridine synthase [Nostocales cyanobacterium LE14-WE4]OBQ11052.1 MAG: pseudouridine synthase [Anabaena sp. LE011-02]QSV53701.1 MAG: RluA family pseudouridine synthase [Dolichospermum sp. UKL201]MCE2703390.1 RluA family pseudouridine synthase [Anabaena sp. 49633_E8]
MSAINNIQVTENSDRLDRYLSQELSDLSRSRIQQLIEQGHVQINNLICTSKKINLKTGDLITLEIPTVQPLAIIAENIPLDILYEDDELIIINKPAGLVVHPAPGHPDGTLVNAILAHCPNLPGIGGIQRPGIVHRLDKDTTGAIAIAKTDLAYQHLQAQLQAKTARREYLGLIYGVPKTETGSIDLPIGRNPQDRKRMAIVSIEDGGRNAVTHWRVKERFGNYTLIHFQLETGRTHQIRVHSAKMGHPLVGDPIYSSGHSLGVNLPGQALHAWKLQLQHPVAGNLVEVTAPLPRSFATLLEVLRRRSGLY